VRFALSHKTRVLYLNFWRRYRYRG